MRVQRGRHIPRPGNVSLMTFDDPEWTTVVSSTLTPIEQPLHRIGKSTTQRLLRLIASQGNSKANEPEVIELKSMLLVRESSGPASESEH